MNYYAKAIDIVSDAELDCRALVIEIAKRHPKVLCDVYSDKFQGYVEACRDLMRDGRLVDAIKHWRLHTGQGLKEAKESCEALI